MIRHLKKIGLAGLAVAALTTAGTATEARDRYYDRDNDAAVAIGAGIIGLAIGAALADRDDRYYYDRSYYGHRRYVTVRGRPGYYYYYDGYPNRYYRDRYYSRYYAPYYRERYSNRYYRDRNYYGRDYRYDRRDYRRDYRRDQRRDYRDQRRYRERQYREDRRDRRRWRDR